MRVAFVNRMLGIRRSGGGMWDYRMAEQLRERGVDVTFYVAEPLTGELTEDLSPFECVPVPTPHLQDIAYAAPRGIGGVLADIDARVFASRVHAKLVDEAFDVVQYNTNREFARYTDRVDAPTVLKLNGPPYSLYRDVLNPFTESSYDVLEAFDAVVTTGATTEAVRERSGVEPVEINPGVDTDQFTPGARPVDGPRFLFVGRFVPAKNLTTLVDAFATVRDRCPDAELTLVGDGPLRDKVAERVRENELDAAVTLPGYVPNEDIPEYYRDATAFVLASSHESFGIVLLEAMSAGIPVVAPAIDAIPRIVDDGENGLLVEPDSASRWPTRWSGWPRRRTCVNGWVKAVDRRPRASSSGTSAVRNCWNSTSRSANGSVPHRPSRRFSPTSSSNPRWPNRATRYRRRRFGET
ncbi:glycosyltransferase [Halapricum sp. CBA1109]|uniref:glycosyltransferase family 4 protein n=1 Tax=Halapricum sp. CBA1109 TaxID=2668068 RepID=UPI0012FA7227|nr:glycosyltransferase family 4 protein [Halapricum sp. CBA1109]MUV88835.1 glycosyltransferase [Halapricum sp. CBA1109]